MEASERSADRWSTAASAGTNLDPLSSPSPGDPGTEAAAPQTPPPRAARLVVFNPDGTLAIAIDPLRQQELTEGHGRVGEASEGEVGQDQAVASAVDDDPAFNFGGWQSLHTRYKVTFLLLICFDIAYLMVLLGLRLAWGTERDGPDSAAVQFFLANPSDLKLAFLIACAATDAVALLAALREYSPILSLFVMWSVVLTAFAVMAMPLLFLFLRVFLVVAAFQLRFSISRLRNLLPPTTAAEWLFSAGQALALGIRGVGFILISPFRWAALRRRRQRSAHVDIEAGGAGSQGLPQTQRQGSAGRQEQGGAAATAAGVGANTASSGVGAAELSSAGRSSRRSRGAGAQQGSSPRAGSPVPAAGAESAPAAAVGGGGPLQSRAVQSRRTSGSSNAASLDVLYLELMRDLQAVQPAAGVASGSRSVGGAAGGRSPTASQSGGGSGSAPQPGSSEAAAQQGASGGQVQQGGDSTAAWIRREQERRQRERRRGAVPLITVEEPE